MRTSFRLIAILGISISMMPVSAFSQASAAGLTEALAGKTISPGVQIGYEGIAATKKYDNNPSSSPVKTYVYSNAEKYYVESGPMIGFLKSEAEYPRFFDLGTEFKITSVKLEKQDVELVLAPVSAASAVGDVKVMIGAGYGSKTTQEVVAIINQMLQVGTAVASKHAPPTSSGPVTLDCTPNQAMESDQLEEVVFDETARTATFQATGKPKPAQPAVFTDAQIQWDNGRRGNDREFYALNRSNGILAIKNTDTTMARVTGNSGLTHAETMLFTCSLRAKKF